MMTDGNKNKNKNKNSSRGGGDGSFVSCPAALMPTVPARRNASRNTILSLASEQLSALSQSQKDGVRRVYERLAMCDAPRDSNLSGTSVHLVVAMRHLLLFLRTAGAFVPMSLHVDPDTSSKHGDLSVVTHSAMTVSDLARYVDGHASDLLACSLVLLSGLLGERTVGSPGGAAHANALLFVKAPTRVTVYLVEPWGRAGPANAPGTTGTANSLHRQLGKALAWALNHTLDGARARKRRNFVYGGPFFDPQRLARGGGGVLRLQCSECQVAESCVRDPGGYCATWTLLITELLLQQATPRTASAGAGYNGTAERAHLDALASRALGPLLSLDKAAVLRKLVIDYGHARQLESAALLGVYAARAREKNLPLPALIMRRALWTLLGKRRMQDASANVNAVSRHYRDTQAPLDHARAYFLGTHADPGFSERFLLLDEEAAPGDMSDLWSGAKSYAGQVMRASAVDMRLARGALAPSGSANVIDPPSYLYTQGAERRAFTHGLAARA